MPTPTQPPSPLALERALESKWCVSESRWVARFRLTASGGTGQYTYYRDVERIHGPTTDTVYVYELEYGASAAAVGSFAVESGDQRVKVDFWEAHPSCARATATHTSTPTPTMTRPPTLTPTPTATLTRLPGPTPTKSK